MKTLPPGPCLDAIVARVLHGTNGFLSIVPYSRSFADAESALEWLVKHADFFGLKYDNVISIWWVHYETSWPCRITNTPDCSTPAHAIALAVFAVGVATGIVDEEGNLK